MAFNEDTSFIEYPVDQPTQDFVTNFDTIGGTTDVVLVTVDGVLTDIPESSYTVQQINHTTWRVTPEVQTGSVVRLYRVTNIDEMMHVFTAGAKFIARNMDSNFKQIRHAQQEVRDRFDFLEYNTLGVVEAARDATDRANNAADEVEGLLDKELDHNDLRGRDVPDAHPASAISYKGINQSEYNDGLESIAEMLAINSPQDGMRVFVKSYHLGESIGGGTFYFDPLKALENNGVTVFNGWVREKKDTYLIEDAGVLANSGLDNTALYANLILAIPEYSKIKFGVHGGEYKGQFMSDKSFDVDVNGANLHLQDGVDDGVVVSFRRLFNTLNVVGTSIDKYADQVVISGQPDIQVGDILTLWDGMRRPSDNLSVHFETVSVKSVEADGLNTLVTFNEILYSPFQGASIVAHWYANPIQKPAVRNYRIRDNETNANRCVFFGGCVKPYQQNGYVENNFGNGCTFFACISPESDRFHCSKPRGVSIGGGGYGLVFSRCRNLYATKTTGLRTRHALDLDSCYGEILIDSVEDFDAYSALVGVGHNGFVNGHNIVVSNLNFVTKEGTWAVGVSRQGLSAADLPRHTIDTIKISGVSMYQSSDTTIGSAQCYPVYIQINAGNIIVDNVRLKHKNKDVAKTNSAVSLFRHRGYADLIKLTNLSADVVARTFVIENTDVDKVGLVSIQNVNVEYQNSYSLVRGANLDINGYSYAEVAQSGSCVIQHVPEAKSPSKATHVSIKGFTQSYGDTSKLALPYESTSISSRLYGEIEFYPTKFTALSAETYVSTGIPTSEFYSRYGSGLIQLTSSAAVTIGGTRPLPHPYISSGMQVALQNIGTFDITIGSGQLNSTITVPAGSVINIISRDGSWRQV